MIHIIYTIVSVRTKPVPFSHVRRELMQVDQPRHHVRIGINTRQLHSNKARRKVKTKQVNMECLKTGNFQIYV